METRRKRDIVERIDEFLDRGTIQEGVKISDRIDELPETFDSRNGINDILGVLEDMRKDIRYEMEPGKSNALRKFIRMFSEWMSRMRRSGRDGSPENTPVDRFLLNARTLHKGMKGVEGYDAEAFRRWYEKAANHLRRHGMQQVW